MIYFLTKVLLGTPTVNNKTKIMKHTIYLRSQNDFETLNSYKTYLFFFLFSIWEFLY